MRKCVVEQSEIICIDIVKLINIVVRQHAKIFSCQVRTEINKSNVMLVNYCFQSIINYLDISPGLLEFMCFSRISLFFSKKPMRFDCFKKAWPSLM